MLQTIRRLARTRRPPAPATSGRGPLGAALALLLGATLTGSLARAQERATEERADVGRVTVNVEGVTGAARDNVLGYLSLAQRRGDALPESEVRPLYERAARQIATALEPFGYYRPVTTSELARDGGRWVATFRIDPGPLMRIDSLDVRILGPGADDRAFRRPLARLPVREGEPLEHARYEESKRMLTDAALRYGYLAGRYARNEIRVDLERYRGTVVLHYESGPRYVFGPVTFNQSVMDPGVLEGYVTFRRGEVVDFNQLLEMEHAMSSSPYWSRVEVRPRLDLAQGDAVPIVVDLTPARREKYTVGAGYGTDNGVHGRAAVELRRLNRRGHRGRVEATASTLEWSGAAKYEIPWPYPHTDVLTASVGYRELETVTSLERTGIAGLSLARLRAGWQETFGLTYRRENFEVGVDRASSNFFVPEASWARVQSDSPIDPRDGRALRFHVQGAERNLLSAESYLRADAHAIWMRGFGRRDRHRGIARAEIGSIWTDGFRRLPPSARFFAGGAQNVRGFAFQSLGPRDEAGNVIGGQALVVTSLEYEHRFRRTWGWAVFWDAGNALRSFSGALEHGAGVGARWVSPIGLVRVDFAVPLTTDDRKLEVHLAVGSRL